VESAILDKYYSVELEGEKMLTVASKCSSCKAYRATLQPLSSRQKQQAASTPTKRTDASSYANFRYLSTPEKAAHFSNCSARAKLTSTEVEKLKKKIVALNNRDGMNLDEVLHNDFVAMFNDATDEVQASFALGTFKRLFWEQQAESLNCDGRQMRWHPMIIKWCLNLKLMSTSEYSAMRSSGVLTFHSERTLRDCTHLIQTCTGFNDEVDAQL